jgi:hypothetical protein
MHVTATQLRESAISGDEFRSTMSRLADRFRGLSDPGPNSAVGVTDVVTAGGRLRVGAAVPGRVLTVLAVTSLWAGQGPATLWEPVVEGSCHQ